VSRNISALRGEKIAMQGAFCRYGRGCEGPLEYAHLAARTRVSAEDDTDPDGGHATGLGAH
jgi:hypothetical protein